MSLGFSSTLKGDSRSQTNVRVGVVEAPSVYTVTPSKAETSTVDKTILTLPSCGSIVYTSILFVLTCSVVGALWIMAVGLWQIKHYVECSQGIVDCSN